MERVLITGANGFIGWHLSRLLTRRGYTVRGAVRSRHQMNRLPEREQSSRPASLTPIGRIDSNTSWGNALEGIDVVVHLAGRAHITRDWSPDPISEFRRVNVDGTRELAEQAASSGVKRFVFVSSIGIFGNSTPEGEAFNEQTPPAPGEPYSISKWEAERCVSEVSARTGMELVILRPPLVYGPGEIKGNLLRLMRAVHHNWVIPLGGIRNLRSFIGLENLCDALALCATRPEAANEAFVISDGADISTPELIRKIASVMGKRALLLTVPESSLWFIGAVAPTIGKTIQRISGSLRVNSGRFRDRFQWVPPETLDQGISSMVSYYLANNS